MHIELPIEPLYILYMLQKQGFEAYIAGGAVRDVIIASLKKSITKQKVLTAQDLDFDFTTSAKPEEIQSVFPESFYTNTFGTVSITHEHLCEQLQLPCEMDQHTDTNKDKKINVSQATKLHESLEPITKIDADTSSVYANYEITTFRSNEQYQESYRKPSSLCWGTSLEEDLQRRDFTINAMALTCNQAFLEQIFEDNSPLTVSVSISDQEYTLIDKHNGMKDLAHKSITTVGDPHTRFKEDALRMLRAIRLSVQLGMQISEATFEAIITHSALITYVSKERISQEFLKMLTSSHPRDAILALDEAQLLKFILPELLDAKGVHQGGHHTTDVWTHSIDALHESPSNDPIVRLATLLHDIGKPRTFALKNSTPTFYNHEVVGARMAKRIGKQLRLSRHDINRLYILVRFHMFHYQPQNSDASIRRFMRKVGLENLNDILDLREADRLGSGARRTSWRLEEMKQRMEEQLHQPFAIKDLAINGHDLMQKFDLKPGKHLGEILQYLFEQVVEDPELNTQDTLLNLSEEYLRQNKKYI